MRNLIDRHPIEEWTGRTKRPSVDVTESESNGTLVRSGAFQPDSKLRKEANP